MSNDVECAETVELQLENPVRIIERVTHGSAPARFMYPQQLIPWRASEAGNVDSDWSAVLAMQPSSPALASGENGRAQLLSRNGHPFASFSALAESISDSLPNARAVIDGEICSLDRRGRPQFKNLLFRRGNPPCFFAFDLLVCDSRNLRSERLIDRKQELRRLLRTTSVPFPLRYADHVEDSGTALFERVCELDLEGIVAKHKSGPYVAERENSTWFKVLNRGYSQMQGREELFERERHKEPVPGWHSCVLACAEWST